MPKKRKGELPSGNIRKKIYDHSELCFDEHGNPVIDPKTGRQKKIKKYISVTGETVAEANQLKAQVMANKQLMKRPLNLTLYEAIDKYIQSSDAVLSPATIRGYRTIQRNAFKSIMYCKLSQLSTELLRDAVNTESKRTTGKKNPRQIKAKTVINEYGLITAVINTYAPALDCTVKLPQIEHNQHEISTPDVIYQIVKDTPIELPALLAMWLSLTESEILGLTKSKSISSDGCYITIKEVIVKNEHNNAVVKNKGKQPTRDRTLRLPEYLKQLIDKIETDQLVTLSGTALSKRFNRLITKAGIPHMTFHDLRHVNASVMAVLRIPDKYAQERGGWKTDHIMKSTYMQTFSSERAAIDNQIDQYMQDTLFKNASEQKKEQKYHHWLELFDLKDTKTNQKHFLKFCEDNHINL